MLTETAFIVADNQCISQWGVHRWLSHLFGRCETVSVSNKKELVSACLKYPHGAVVLDYSLFDFYGVEDLLVMSKRFPDIYWLLFSTELSTDLIRRLSAEEHMGFLLKDCGEEEIRHALLAAAEHTRFVCRAIIGQLEHKDTTPDEATRLTPSEAEILRLIARGKSVKEIAELRHSSIHTITTHKKNIFRKIEVNTTYEATKYALRAGLVEMAEYYI